MQKNVSFYLPSALRDEYLFPGPQGRKTGPGWIRELGLSVARLHVSQGLDCPGVISPVVEFGNRRVLQAGETQNTNLIAISKDL